MRFLQFITFSCQTQVLKYQYNYDFKQKNFKLVLFHGQRPTLFSVSKQHHHICRIILKKIQYYIAIFSKMSSTDFVQDVALTFENSPILYLYLPYVELTKTSNDRVPISKLSTLHKNCYFTFKTVLPSISCFLFPVYLFEQFFFCTSLCVLQRFYIRTFAPHSYAPSPLSICRYTNNDATLFVITSSTFVKQRGPRPRVVSTEYFQSRVFSFQVSQTCAISSVCVEPEK